MSYSIARRPANYCQQSWHARRLSARILRRRQSRSATKLYTIIMETLPTILLKPGEADRIVAGHPWVYHNEILRLTQEIGDGELVQVKDHRQRMLGPGFAN